MYAQCVLDGTGLIVDGAIEPELFNEQGAFFGSTRDTYHSGPCLLGDL